jgi:hypothetical protein
MVRSMRSRVFPIAAAVLLLAASASSTAAAPAGSFSATWCYAADYNGLANQIVATFAWSGYKVDEISMGSGDGSGAGFGFVEPLNRTLSKGTLVRSIGAYDGNTVAGVSILYNEATQASDEIDRPGDSWSNLPDCNFPKSVVLSACKLGDTGQIVATITWRGYWVDSASFFIIDGAAGVTPVDPPAREGSVSGQLGADNDYPTLTAGIQFKNRVAATRTLEAPDGDWANLPDC